MAKDVVKKYSLTAWILAGVSLLLLAAFVILLAVAEWHLLAMRPFWLGCLFLMLGGLGLAAACVLGYIVILKREERASTVFCGSCGRATSCENAFCPHCGAAIETKE